MMKSIMCKSIVLLLLFILLSVPQFVSSQAGKEKESLVNILCSPVYQGRGVGMEGNQLAAQLLAQRLEAYGLVPLNGHSNFLISFEQRTVAINEMMLVAIGKDGSREELRYGQDYTVARAAGALSGTLSISLQAEAAGSSAVLFMDPAVESLPAEGLFPAMVYPVDVLSFQSLGVNDQGPRSDSLACRIDMLRPVYERISKAEALDIRYDYSKTSTMLHNVVGVLPGKDRTKGVVLSAHFDGVGEQGGNRLPGAMDNASGVAAVDWVAAQMAGTEPPYDVVIAFTNAEEAGLMGAQDLAVKLLSQYEALYNINVDCLGVKELPFLMESPGGISTMLYGMMAVYLNRNGFVSIQENYGRSDHLAFERAGIPAVILGAPAFKVEHTINDTAERIDLDMIYAVAGVIVDFIQENPGIHAAMAQSHAEEPALKEVPTLAYNEAVRQDNILYTGSMRWLTHEEALSYHPALPLPKLYKGRPMAFCMVILSTLDLADSAPGQVINMEDSAPNITSINAFYSDGVTSYRLQFRVGYASTLYGKQKIGEEGFYLTSRENNEEVIEGIGLQRGDMSLCLFDGDAAGLLEIEDGIFVETLENGTSKVTKENASDLLTDNEFTGLFEALTAFVQP